MAAFYAGTQEMGVAQNVTTFTESDFSRTFQPTSGDGADHAWGSHHMVLGGAVQGGQIYGAFPAFELGGPNDTDTRGRWIPTTSVDQYGATLASWFGIPDTSLPTVFPNFANFGIEKNRIPGITTNRSAGTLTGRLLRETATPFFRAHSSGSSWATFLRPDTSVSVCRLALLHQIFEAQAQAHPDHAAVRFGSAQITYGELDARANRIARSLGKRGVKQRRDRRPAAATVGRRLCFDSGHS